MTDEQFKYWNKKTAESKCNWFDKASRQEQERINKWLKDNL